MVDSPSRFRAGVCVASASAHGEPARFQRILESFLHRTESLNELKLLTVRPLAVDQRPAVRLALRDLVGVCVEWSGPTLLFRPHRDHAVGFDLAHAPTRRFHLKVVDEFVEVDIVANVEADVHRAWISGAHVVPRLCPAVSATPWLLGFAIL